MDDILSAQEEQALQDLDGHSPDHVHGHAFELELSTQFVQIYVQQLEDEAGMTPKEESMFQLHDIALSTRVHHSHCLQDSHLHLSLSVEFRLVTDHLHCHQLTLTVIE